MSVRPGSVLGVNQKGISARLSIQLKVRAAGLSPYRASLRLCSTLGVVLSSIWCQFVPGGRGSFHFQKLAKKIAFGFMRTLTWRVLFNPRSI